MRPSPIPPAPPLGRLPREQFLSVVAHAPLVSIDLIVRDGAGRVLLGLRRNAPARGTWFVPGGCVRKNETLDTAFVRISRDELGLAAQRGQAEFLGVFEHLYADNAGGEPGFGTHYVVLAHVLPAGLPVQPPPDQHSDYRWFEPAGLLADAAVHDHTKAYFR
ncbi:MAG: GDP-mannose mannosyl hydrolase [Nevskia sp.]|nr:GDP-mannose mannosyl hydrolase [Nevskia sp.]